MATTGRTAADDSDAAALASTLRAADFVHFVSHADGDAIAAAGLLAAASSTTTPFQVSTVRTRAAADRRIESNGATTVAIGIDAEDADASIVAESNALAAFEVAAELGDANPALASAGAVAAGTVPGSDVLEAAGGAITRRPGVAVPTADLADGLAHSTLVHADLSGDEQRAGAMLAELDVPAEIDETAHRQVASAVALAATEPPAPPRAVNAIEGALRPHVLPDGPVETVEGYADVLESLARSDPGLATAMALGRVERTTVLEAWRDHASAVHEAVRLGERTRYDGFVGVVTERADPWTTARLVRDFRSGEPMVLVVGETEVALATTDTNALDRLAALDTIESVGGRDRLAAGTTEAPMDELVTAMEDSQ